MMRWMLHCVILLSTGLGWAQESPPAASEAVPKGELLEMYKAELGDAFTPEIGEKLHIAHALVEKYFATPKAADRSAVAREIEGLGVDPNHVGRIVRIRLYWPKLKGGVYYINERVGPHEVIYFLGVPDAYDRAKPWPMVIKLPGMHAFVGDPPPSQEEVVSLYRDWIREELAAHPDAIVLMPLMNLNELWGPSYKGMNSVIQPMHHAAGRLNIDPRRIYLWGHSMSGHAAWNFAIHYPTYFSAFAAMSAGMNAPFQRLRVANLRNILSVVWHDADDKTVPVDGSRSLVKQLRATKYDVDYEETKQVGHAPSPQITERLYGKMRARVRDLYPRETVISSNRPDTLFNRADWAQVYQPLTPGGDERLRIRRGTGIITVNRNPHDLTATLVGPNRIDVKSRNVESMRLYFNDQMIDFTKPVTILVNTRPRFEGMLKPDVEEMLKDQMFLGRGWRYYTAWAEVDFGAPKAAPTTRP